MSGKELALRPSCSVCGVFLELRNPPGGYTPEQKFCGVWYDHPPVSLGQCSFGTASVLYVSGALKQQLAAVTR